MSRPFISLWVFTGCASVLILGCSGMGESSGTTMIDPITGYQYYMEEGAPDPLACQSDDDCVASTLVDEKSPCCVVPSPYVQSRAWKEWIESRRSALDCAKVSCPELPRFAPPPTCVSQVRCAEGRCMHSCNQ